MNAFWLWLAYRLPKRLVYYCGIRIGVNGTCGKYSNQVVGELTMIEGIKRWDNK